MIELRGTRFSSCWDQSGLRNFDGHGYPYHQHLKKLFDVDFSLSTFVAKTSTWEPRLGKAHGQAGNMALLDDGMTPSEFKPKCICITPRSFLHRAALNAVGLSGPGLEVLLEKEIWHYLRNTFQISLMATALTRAERITQVKKMVAEIKRWLPFHSPFGVQWNVSCPNVDHEQEVDRVLDETIESLSILRELGEDVALIPKINALFPVWAAIRLAEDPNCDALCNSNAIPWNDVPPDVRKKLFGTTFSPLNDLGSGGLSGAPWLLHLVERWLRKARKDGLKKPVIAGGGIGRASDVDVLAHAGASAVAIGSVVMLRPWRVNSIISRAMLLGENRVSGFYPYPVSIY